MSAHRRTVGRACLPQASALAALTLAGTSISLLGTASAAHADTPQVQARIVDLSGTMTAGQSSDDFGVALFNASRRHGIDVTTRFQIRLTNLRPGDVRIWRGPTELAGTAVGDGTIELTDPQAVRVERGFVPNPPPPLWYRITFTTDAPGGTADVLLTVIDTEGKQIGHDNDQITVKSGAVAAPQPAPPATKPGMTKPARSATPAPSRSATAAAPSLGQSDGTAPPPARGAAEPLASLVGDDRDSNTMFYVLGGGLAALGTAALWLIVRRPREVGEGEIVETVREILHPTAILPAIRRDEAPLGESGTFLGHPQIVDQS